MTIARRGEISVNDYEAKKASKNQSTEGYEIPDATPMAPPLGYVKAPSITERIREMVRSEHLRQAAERAGAETFEEADDFDVPDDLEPASLYENDDIFEPAPRLSDMPGDEPPKVKPAPAKTSTGVPPSGGGGEGAGGEPSSAPQPAEVSSPAPAEKPVAGPRKRS